MPEIPLGISAYERDEGGLPQTPLLNMYVEQGRTETTILHSRHGLEVFDSKGSGPIRAIFKEDGILGGAVVTVTGNRLFVDNNDIGEIVGGGAVSIAGNESGIYVTAGGAGYHYDGSTFTQIAFPDDAPILKFAESSGRIIAIRGNSGTFYWTEPLQSTFDALNFATAESKPDQLLDIIAIDDLLVLLGSETVEFWPNVNDDNLPFVPLEGRVYEKGIKNTGSAVIIGSTFVWVGDDNVVYTQGASPTPISDAGIEEKIGQSETCSMFIFFIEGAEFAALRLDDRTYVWNLRTNLWSEMASYGQDNWIPSCYTAGLFGSSIDSSIYQWSVGYADLGGPLERRIRAGFPLNGGSTSINNLSIRVNSGETPFLTGSFDDPIVEMRFSRDLGNKWSAWKPKTMGRQGEYKNQLQWRALGNISAPGVLFEWRITDPVPFRISGAFINEAYGGR